MAQYRRKPLIVDAEQFDPEKPWPEKVQPWTHGKEPTSESGGYMELRNGMAVVLAKDWIVKDADGSSYPMRPDAFEQNFERVETSNQRTGVLLILLPFQRLYVRSVIGSGLK